MLNTLLMHDGSLLEITHLIPQHGDIETNLPLNVVADFAIIHSIYQTQCGFEIVQGLLLKSQMTSVIPRVT